jgi:tRNA-modifying protein YgfZ
MIEGMETAVETGLFVDRSERAKLRFTGEQRVWFLDQMLTQAFEGAKPGRCLDAAFITVHGRMQGYMEFLVLDDALLAHFEPSLRSSLPDELRKYVFATRVEIEDVTDDYGLVLVAHPDVGDLVDDIDADAQMHWTASLGVPAAYLWIEAGKLGEVTDRLSASGVKPGTEDELEAIRIGNGVARWGFEMNEKTFPQEAGVDGRAVHYEKGCYLGQEAMAKIHFRGKVNRKLVRLEGGAPLEVGSDVVLGGSKVGTVTSVAGNAGLALLRHTTEAGAEVVVGSVPARVLDS